MGKDKSSNDETKKLLYNAALISGYAMGLGPLLPKIVESSIDSIDDAKKVAESGDLEKLQLESKRQEIELRMHEFRAKVAQEVAIARRIDTAEEVEIEEFYDTSGRGNIGLDGNEGGVSFGIGGEGRIVTKRIYRFKGWREGGIEVELKND